MLAGRPAARNGVDGQRRRGKSAQQEGFIPINPTKSNKTIVLKGNRLTIQDIVDIARYGAKVKIAKSHQDYMNRAYNLIIEASRQGIPVYRFNRGAGAARETVIFEETRTSRRTSSTSRRAA